MFRCPANHHSLLIEFPDGIIPIDRETYIKTSVSIDELKSRDLPELCSPVRVSPIVLRTASGVFESIGFPNVPVVDAHKVDGIQPSSSADQLFRFTSGPRWNLNSCALDSVFYLLLTLEMGRCQSDQVHESFLRKERNYFSLTAMSILRKPWASLAYREKMQLRDVLRGLFQAWKPKVYGNGNFVGVSEIFDQLAACSGQFSATYATLVRCCHAGQWCWVLRPAQDYPAFYVELGKYVSLELMPAIAEAPTFEQQIQILFNTYPFRRSSGKNLKRCKSCKDSGNPPEQQKVVLDRPPYTLVFHDFHDTGSDGAFQAQKPGMYVNINLVFQQLTPKGKLVRITAQYAFWGAIFCQNKSHFVAVVNLKAREHVMEYCLYDGMKNGGEIQVMDESIFEFARKPSNTLQMLFYVRVR